MSFLRRRNYNSIHPNSKLANSRPNVEKGTDKTELAPFLSEKGDPVKVRETNQSSLGKLE